ncbi:hypothetical protein L873DRAFT_1811288 [Choiromyces venosus 120613-1]|uniref:Uncharacterized protein n=1 Tax=Choiromyces venosus 120613-1 TaxID=1336337 RepID=A0A3N4JDT5_9PEZI|nr:hypothetical protein L873DRAFT_1811288 [Choiromyces venosus 120613-1]
MAAFKYWYVETNENDFHLSAYLSSHVCLSGYVPEGNQSLPASQIVRQSVNQSIDTHPPPPPPPPPLSHRTSECGGAHVVQTVGISVSVPAVYVGLWIDKKKILSSCNYLII